MDAANLEKLKPTNHRWVLSCDGGGIRGIITLRCLQALEQHLGKQCIELFDMFAGTSTGAIIAGCLAAGLTTDDLIRIYQERRTDLFNRSFWSYPFGRLATKYLKRPVHELLCEFLRNRTLGECGTDIMITATDTIRSETTYFTTFHHAGAAEPHGLYQFIRLRDAVEASISAPTYFRPHGRFIDGGVGVANNPCYVAAVEALEYSHDPKKQQPKYLPGEITVLAFGTGAESNHMAEGEAEGKFNLGWIDFLIGEGMDQANEQQSLIMDRELDRLEAHMTFYRYQLYLRNDVPSRACLQDLYGEPLPDWFGERGLPIDSIDDERFEFLDRLGQRWGQRLMAGRFFLKHPSTRPPVAGVSPWGNYESRCYVRPTDAEREAYAREVAAEFQRIDEELGGCT